jgi:hypothetical protein
MGSARRRIAVGAFALLVCVAAGCASYTSLRARDRRAVDEALSAEGKVFFLRLSFYVTPFFGDADKRLLTDVPPDELAWARPGEAASTLPVESIAVAGTEARVLEVQFPTATVVASRKPGTPVRRPWVLLELKGDTSGRPFVLVLPEGLTTRDEIFTEVERYLTREDPARQLATWSEAVREAVATKRAMPEMPKDALQMAWGYPQRIREWFENGSQRERWSYAGDRRVAELADGRVSQLSPGADEDDRASPTP